MTRSSFLLRTLVQAFRGTCPGSLFDAIRLLRADLAGRHECELFQRRVQFSHWEQVGTPLLEWNRGFFEIDLEPDGLVIDCGANIGMLAVLLSSRKIPFRYIGFEPLPALYAFAEKNVSGLGEVRQQAISTSDGKAKFWVDKNDYLTGSSLSRTSGWEEIMVETVAFQRLADGKKIDLLKIDIEGAEYDVLSDRSVDFASVRNIIVDVHPSSERELAPVIQQLERYFILRLSSDFTPRIGWEKFCGCTIYGRNKNCC